MGRTLRPRGVRFTNALQILASKVPCPDGLPAQCVIVFVWRSESPISYVVDGRSLHGISADIYAAAAPAQQMLWESEIHQGRLGYILIGSARQGNLWHVVAS